jgi:YVTN family beta-propeller protein
MVYVSNRLTNRIFVLDANTGQVVNSIGLGEPPYALAFSPATERLFVILADSGRLEVRDAHTLTRLALLPLGQQ